MTERVTKTLRTVWAALLAGQLLFLVVTLALPERQAQPDQARLMVPMAYIMMVSSVAISLALPMIWARGDAGSPPAEGVLYTRQIMRMALLEGSGLFTLVVFFLTGSYAVLPAFAIALLLFVASYPRPAHR